MDYLFKGEIINVRLLAPSDFEQLKLILNDRDVMVHLMAYFGRDVWSDKDVQDRMDMLLAATKNKSRLTFVTTTKQDDKMWGQFDLMRLGDVKGEAEFGIIVHKKLWGGGAAAEAFLYGLEYGFSQLNLNRIWCQTHADNLKMQKFFINNGFQNLGETGENYLSFDLAKSNWPQCKEKLIQRLKRQKIQ